MATVRLGTKLRHIRELRGLTLKAVAAAAGVSESLVSQIEHDRVSPAIDTLFALCLALETGISELFADLAVGRNIQVVHAGERVRTSRPGVAYEQLASTAGMPSGHELEAWRIVLAPGASTGSSDCGHPGLELGILITGRATLSVGRETVALVAGDSVSFTAGSPHRLTNDGSDDLVAFWITTPPGSKSRLLPQAAVETEKSEKGHRAGADPVQKKRTKKMEEENG